jgi:hypothetical protein
VKVKRRMRKRRREIKEKNYPDLSRTHEEEDAISQLTTITIMTAALKSPSMIPFVKTILA